MSVTKRVRNINGKKKLTYRAQVYVSGVRVADKVFDTLAAAYTWHDQEKEKIENGLVNNDESISQSLTFDECLTRYVEERLSKLELSSRQARELRVIHFRNCPISKMKMAQINSKAVDLWLFWILKQKTAQCVKRKSFLLDLRFLTALLNWYRNYIDADFHVPITKRHRELACYKKIKPRRPDYYAKPEEVRSWLQWLKEHRKPQYYRLACFLMLTGCRVGEATGMCWSEIDLANRVARVVRVVVWDQRNKRPHMEERAKTDGSIRLVMLPEILVKILLEMKEEAVDKTGPIFTQRNGNLLHYNAIQSAFNAGFKSLGLPWRSTHICRHTYATAALMATRDLNGVQAALGHASQRMTEKYAKNVALLHSQTAEKTAEFLQIDFKK